MIDACVTVMPPPQHSVRHFARWVASTCEPGARVLNVGAGADVSGGLAPLRQRVPYLVGVDPDRSVLDNPWLSERHQMTVEEFAIGRSAEFDAIIAVYVLEHVVDPVAFAEACARLLRPGGSFFALTLNITQYFGAATWAMSRLHRSDWLLERLKGDALVHEHHFPTVYRFNSIRRVRRTCEAAGFSSLELRCYDATERYQWYLPEAIRWFPPAWTRLAYAAGAPSLMGHLSFRAVR